MSNSNRPKESKTTRIYKSRKNKLIDGVCGGLAEYMNWDVKLVRIFWVISLFLNGLGLVAYIVAMIIVPVNPDHKNLKDEEKVKSKPALYWGIGLILVGFLFILDEWHPYYRWDFPFNFRFGRWLHFHWDTYWPLLLVALGVFYIVYVISRGKSETDEQKKTEQKQKSDRRLLRTKTEKIIGGVCGGIGKHFEIDPTFIRIGLVAIAVLTNIFLWVIVYLAFLIIVPQEDVSEPSVSKK